MLSTAQRSACLKPSAISSPNLRPKAPSVTNFKCISPVCRAFLTIYSAKAISGTKLQHPTTQPARSSPRERHLPAPRSTRILPSPTWGHPRGQPQPAHRCCRLLLIPPGEQLVGQPANCREEHPLLPARLPLPHTKARWGSAHQAGTWPGRLRPGRRQLKWTCTQVAADLPHAAGTHTNRPQTSSFPLPKRART